ncbi:unnamed protein product [Bemisia tabaci]|uniref:Uncharacterized protein n=1 Tax=Bemisia tabaci TaxID=7038 RepID=A0A9P0ALZ1_BEMTA|nr:unnamed protein product [Bemisia tabaci]
MTVDIYHIGPSPPCRAVRLAAKLIGVDVNLKVIDITKGEQMTPEFLKWPLVFKVGPHDEKKFQEIPKNLPVLEKILEESEFVAGDCITVADASIVTIISNYDMVGVDFSKYPNISRWYDKCKKVIPDYDEINQKGAEDFKKFWEHLRSL